MKIKLNKKQLIALIKEKYNGEVTFNIKKTSHSAGYIDGIPVYSNYHEFTGVTIKMDDE